MARLNDPTSGHERRANIGQITSNQGSQLSGAPYHGELKQHQGFISGARIGALEPAKGAPGGVFAALETQARPV